MRPDELEDDDRFDVELTLDGSGAPADEDGDDEMGAATTLSMLDVVLPLAELAALVELDGPD